MSAEPMIETKAECLPRIIGPQSVAPLTDIIAPDETRDLRAIVRRRGRVEATRIVVAPLCDSSSTYSYELGALLLPTPTEITAACVRAARFGLRVAIGSEHFEATQTGSTYEPAQDGSILAGFRRMLEARRVAVGDQHYHALHRQILALLADEEELAEAFVRPSMVSFAGLLQFLQWNAGLKHPSLSLDRQGHFVAAWQPRGRAKLSITFEGVTHAKWIATDRSGPAPARGSGELTMMSAATIDGHFRDWMFA